MTIADSFNKLTDRHWLIYAVLALVITGSYVSGYFIALDTVFTPHMKVDFSSPWALNPTELLMWLMSFAIPMNIIVWLLLFFIVFLSAFGMHRFVEKMGVESKTAKYFAGFLYAINPFTYARFMAGHTLFLLGYALFPFFLCAAVDFFERKGEDKMKRDGKFVVLALWFVVMGSTAIHNLIIAIFAFGVLFVWDVIKKGERREWVEKIKGALLLGFIVILLNSFWIIPVLTTPGGGLSQIREQDVVAFQSVQEKGMNILVTIASMYGFWRNEAYVQPNGILPTWLVYVLFFIILYLSVYGFVKCKKRFKIPLVAIAIIAFLLAVGSSSTITSGLFNLLFNAFPLIGVFREPQKLVSLIAFVYACFGAVGVDGLIGQIKANEEKSKKGNHKLWVLAGAVLTMLVIAIPFVYTPTMFNNFWGQIKPTKYPADWFEVNNFLNNDTNGSFNVLFLPWHEYMDFNWINDTDTRAANMASSFFDKSTIVGDDMEVGSVYSTSTDPRSAYLQDLFARGETGNLTDAGENLSAYGIRYVLLTKEVNYQSYTFLFNQTDLQLVKETENFYVFKNSVPTFSTSADNPLNDKTTFYAFLSGGLISLVSVVAFVWFRRKEIKRMTHKGVTGEG